MTGRLADDVTVADGHPIDREGLAESLAAPTR